MNDICPRCGNKVGCALKNGKDIKTCFCNNIVIDKSRKHVFEKYKDCLCKDCIQDINNGGI